jgi:hypothetical protein
MLPFVTEIKIFFEPNCAMSFIAVTIMLRTLTNGLKPLAPRD